MQQKRCQTDLTQRPAGSEPPARPAHVTSSLFLSELCIQPITDREFKLFQKLIYCEAGIYLSEAKKALLVGRLARRLRALGLSSFRDYYRRIVDQNDQEERVRLLDSICTNETHFFREPHQFDFLQERIIPEFAEKAAAGLRERRIRAWSAACSTGEEAYSLAMVLRRAFPPTSGWQIEILATDLSTRALKVARRGIWPLEKKDEIPSHFLKSSMLKGMRTQEGRMKAAPEIQSILEFARINLNDSVYPIVGMFDLIFCRNVLIYFHAESKARVIEKLISHLSPSGYLFLGHAESLGGLGGSIRGVGPTVYALPPNTATHEEGVPRKSSSSLATRANYPGIDA